MNRHPQHTFSLRHRPYVIQPFCVAPVLPGETLKNISWQARVVTNPMKSSLIGGWLEYYWFYVKLRDMADAATWQQMILDPGVSVSGATVYRSAIAEGTAGAMDHGWHVGTGIDWSLACYKPVVENFFRADGEAYTTHNVGSMALAMVNNNGVFDSAVLNSAMTAADLAVDLDASGTVATIMASEVEIALRRYQELRDTSLVNMTFEDYLRMAGVRISTEDEMKPELIRYVRDWTYPSSHINPSDGAATSALSWSIAEKSDKSRFFREPGFIYGVTVMRPKVYFGGIKRHAASLMDDIYGWLPPNLANQTMASYKKVTDAATDILGGAASSDFWVDLKDLLLYGDQLVNHTLAGTDSNLVALPDASLGHQYVASADLDAMFVSGAAAAGVKQDGVANLTVASTNWHATDTSPRASVTGRVG